EGGRAAGSGPRGVGPATYPSPRASGLSSAGPNPPQIPRNTGPDRCAECRKASLPPGLRPAPPGPLPSETGGNRGISAPRPPPGLTREPHRPSPSSPWGTVIYNGGWVGGGALRRPARGTGGRGRSARGAAGGGAGRATRLA